MIAVASVDDQELAVAAKLTRVHHPAVARRGDLRALSRFYHRAFGRRAILRAFAERENTAPLCRQWQLGPHGDERLFGLDAPGPRPRQTRVGRGDLDNLRFELGRLQRGYLRFGNRRGRGRRILNGGRRLKRDHGGRRRLRLLSHLLLQG